MKHPRRRLFPARLSRCLTHPLARTVILFGAAILQAWPAPSRAADNAAYSATAGPSQNPDANGNTDVWSETLSGGGFRGTFLGNSNQNGGGSAAGAGTSAWGLYAGGATDAQSLITHNFSGGGLAVGQTITINFDNGYVGSSSDSAEVGFNLNNGAFNLHFTGGDAVYRYNDAGSSNVNTGVGYTADGFNVSITMTGATTYSAEITRDNGSTVLSSWTGTLASFPSNIQVYDRNAQGGPNSQNDGGTSDLFVNNLQYGTPTVSGSGNFNAGTLFSTGPQARDYSALIISGTSAATATNDTANALQSITFNAGTAAYTIAGNGRSGNTSVTLAGGVTNNSANLQTINSALTLSADQTFAATSGALTFGGVINQNGKTLTVTGGNNVNLGEITNSPGTGSVQKNGNGTLTLGGSADNVSVGVTVNGGTLVLAKASSSSAHAVGGYGLAINTGGTASLAGSGGDQIYSAAQVTINSGGTLRTNGLSEGTPTTGSTPGVGALTLERGAALDFGSGAGGSTLSAVSGIVFGTTGVISIVNWTGTSNVDSGAAGNDRLLYATDPNFTVDQLARFQFSDDDGVLFAAGGVEFSYHGFIEIVPVPEPATSLAGALALGWCARRWLGRRRLVAAV